MQPLFMTDIHQNMPPILKHLYTHHPPVFHPPHSTHPRPIPKSSSTHHPPPLPFTTFPPHPSILHHSSTSSPILHLPPPILQLPLTHSTHPHTLSTNIDHLVQVVCCGEHRRRIVQKHDMPPFVADLLWWEKHMTTY